MSFEVRIDPNVLGAEREKLCIALDAYLASVQARILSMSDSFRAVSEDVLPVVEAFRDELKNDICDLLHPYCHVFDKFEGMRMDHKSAAKKALRDCIEAYAWKYEQSHVLSFSQHAYVEHFREIAYKFIDQDHGNVVRFRSRTMQVGQSL